MRQYFETHQLRYYVVRVNYILTYISHTQNTEGYLLHTLPSSNLLGVHLHSQRFARFRGRIHFSLD